jgi:hypothetical protein
MKLDQFIVRFVLFREVGHRGASELCQMRRPLLDSGSLNMIIKD